MKETSWRTTVVNMLGPLGAFSVENPAHPGTPDINCTAGWIELKKAEWPARDDTPVDIDMRQTQRIWHRRWRRHGGFSWTLTKVNEEIWILHDGRWSADHLGNVTREVLIANAVTVWWNGPTAAELITTLIKHRRGQR
jgi:hypothetical protein